MPLRSMSLDQLENSDSAQQRDILEDFPALVLLTRGGRIFFANGEALKAL